jgi:gamma-glutamyltranspeptidase/glutathione hydrolase
LQTLALLKGYDLDKLSPTDPDFIHLQIEATKLAFADRDTFYGDPNFVEVPLTTLLSDSYNAERRKLVTDRASMEQRPGSVKGFGEVLTLRRQGDRLVPAGAGIGEPTVGKVWTHDEEHDPSLLGAGEPTVGRMGQTRGDTVHFDIIDQAGNMVSSTPSGGWLQSSPVIPELGFCLGTRGQMFWLRPDLPNSLEPGKRPRTTLSPSFALRGGKPGMAFGTPGGEQQDQWSLIFFLRMLHHGLNIQQAIDAPSFHGEHWPSSFWPRLARPGRLVLEGRFDDAVLAELIRRGHIVEVGPDWSEGRLTAAAREGRRRKAAANARGMQGYAAGR